MLSYSDIIKKSYRVTISYPVLWLFGLFVVGGSNLNFLSYENIPLRHWYANRDWLGVLLFFQDHPGKLALLSLLVLLVSIGGLLLTNWSRVILLLCGESVLKNQRLDFDQQMKKSLNLLWPVIKISLWTSGFMLVVVAALFVPLLFLDLGQDFKIPLLVAATIIFLPLAFTVSCINIFTTFYTVFFKKPIATALNLGTDFFISRWSQILGLVLILAIIYCASFVVGVTLLFLIRLSFELLLSTLARFNILLFSAIIMGLKLVSNILLWFLIGGLSVFFNQALLILFLELNTPIKTEELSEMVLTPAQPSI